MANSSSLYNLPMKCALAHLIKLLIQQKNSSLKKKYVYFLYSSLFLQQKSKSKFSTLLPKNGTYFLADF